MNSITQSQIELVREQVWLETRAKLAEILLQYQILDTHNDSVGFWYHAPDGQPFWMSLYDLLEQNK